MSAMATARATQGRPPMGRARIDTDLQQDIEQFLYFEAELLDDRRYRGWYNLLAGDIRYWMPTRSNRLSREMDKEVGAPGEVAHFDEDKASLGVRVRQLETGMHWAEDPPSRTRHLVTNVRVSPSDVEAEWAVRSNFLCYRNRMDTEVDIWAGERTDTLRVNVEHGFTVAARRILLDQNVILSKNLSVFF